MLFKLFERFQPSASELMFIGSIIVVEQVAASDRKPFTTSRVYTVFYPFEMCRV